MSGSSLSQRQSRPIQQRGADQLQLFCAPRCPRGSVVPYKSEENQFHPVLASLGPGAPMARSLLKIVENPEIPKHFDLFSDMVCFS